ncbi:uncharacterized protein LOC121877115, partial [Homarus americanus]|uniref:uncharacterized protein LOC121877115 n=1 Tax=Homarus americanus TaxID=6706 RepID=UPI001C470FB5
RTIFGITPEQLLARAEMKASDQQTEKLASAIEKKLEREWDKMASFMDPAGYSMYDLEQVVKIPVLVEDTKRKVAEERNKLIHSMTQTDCLFQQVYSLLLEYGKVLLALMSKQRLSHYLTQHLSSCTVTLSIQLQKLR